MLKFKLFRAFAVLVALFSVLSVVVGVRTINQRIVAEAQARVRLNLSSAWAVFNDTVNRIDTVLRLAASKERVIEICDGQKWDDPELLARLDRIRVNFGFDFLDLISPEGRVVLRTRPPHHAGDFRLSDPAVASALQGSGRTCVIVMSARELQAEGEGLAERAFFELEPTPHARKDKREAETRGMVIAGAQPVRKGTQILGVVYGGVLVNRNVDLVDRIQKVVYKDEMLSLIHI
ncbi:MAG: hypothetical protein N2255_05510, partial [Kiritimatiellae bacterium]|nr:hypothetical protein [Kiritimatiellia bacterium]